MTNKDDKKATEKEVSIALKDILNKSGHLHKFKAEIRAKVTEILQERQAHLNSGDHKANPPPPGEEVLLINELIREYLEWNGYLYTVSVMTSEAALPKERKTRNDMCAEVGVRDDEKSSALPLLANIVAAYTERIKRKINRMKRESN